MAEPWLTLHPAAAYRQLAQQRLDSNTWLALRRPLLVAFVLGCTMSLITSGRLTLRLVGVASVYWSFVPLFEIASLAAVCRREPRTISFSRTIDLFFMDHGPWLLWLVGFAAVWAFIPAIQIFSSKALPRISYSSALFVIAWSGYIDFWFFRCVLEKTPARAGITLLLQRLICWISVFVCFLGSSIWPPLATRLGL
jgi:hypothetical protein